MPVPFFNQLVVCDSSQQPAIDQDFCDPTVLLSTITQAAIGNPQGAPFNDITDGVELMQRLSQTAMTDDAIRIFTCAGEKAAPEQTSITIDNRRTIVVQEKNSLVLTITDLAPSVYAMSDYYKKHRINKLWFFIIEAGKMLHGGNNGILIEINSVTNFPSGDNAVVTLVLTCTWSWAPQELQMDDYPLQTGGTGGGSGNIIANPTATITNVSNTSLRLNRSAASPNATDYIFQLYSDAGRTQVARPAQTISATGNAYADFDNLTANTTYYGRIVPIPATGYAAGTGGVVTGQTTNTMRVIYKAMPSAYNPSALPSQTQLETDLNSAGNFSKTGPLTLNFNNPGPANYTFAYPTASGFTPSGWVEDQNPTNTGGFGPGETWQIIGTVGIYTVAQTGTTGYDHAVIVTD